MMTKIGIFDSGSGGLTTLAAIRKLLPSAEYYYIGDTAHCPYGDKSSVELLEITTKIVKRLQAWGASIIVIACNTATTRCIHDLRQRFPDLTFIGTEPAIKVARDANTRHPLLLATPATSRAASVQRLVAHHYPDSPNFIDSALADQNVVNFTTSQITILPCPGLADTIEQNLSTHLTEYILKPEDQLTLPLLNPVKATIIKTKLAELFATIQHPTNHDSIILGCTHYILIKDLIKNYFPTAKLIDGNLGVAKYVQSLLAK